MATEATRVRVEYQVPVSAFVNLETGEVEKVVVWDEEIRPLPRRKNKPDVIPDDDQDGGKVSDKTAERAREIANTAEWPGWRLGA